MPRRDHRPVPAPAAADRALLGAQAASILQISQASDHIQLYIGGTWLTVVGILKPVLLDPNLDTTAFIGLPVAERLFETKSNPSEIYVRADVNDVTRVSNLLAPAADPQNPDGVQVSRPSDVLEARAAKGQFTTLLLALALSRCWSARSGSPTSW